MKIVRYMFILGALMMASSGLFTLYGQEKPLTQAEYVKMLYSLQRSPATKADIIAAVRTRGIDFVVNDGIRSLTKSKSGGDAELLRTLEEAGRRKADPVGSALPPAAEADSLLDRARQATLTSVEDMPDFVVKQLIQRSAAYAGTGNFRNLDRLIVAVSYRASGEESYRVLSVNGLVKPAAESKNSYEEVGGTSSTGEFVTVLATLFKPETETKFAAVDTDLIRDRKAIVYTYEADRDHAKQVVSSVGAAITDTAITGVRGRIWIDRETARILKLESEATELPVGFPITSARRTIDYDWVMIAGEKYMMPMLSDVRLVSRERSNQYETRNLIRFREYQKFGSEVRILDDDEEVVTDKP